MPVPRMRILSAAILVAVLASAASAQVRLVKDIDPLLLSEGSNPFGIASIGNTTFFWATTEELGTELWKTDGTEEGTNPVRDIRPGPASSPRGGYSRYPARVVGSRVLFPADDGEHGIELWASDGTREGTRMLEDMNPGSSSTVFTFGPVIDSVLYFRAETPEAGYELWRTDGTSAGTRMIRDLNPGRSSSVFFGGVLSEFGGLVIFYAFEGTRSGLFATDGTAEGTRFLMPADHYFGGALGETFLFATKNGENGPWTLLRMDRSGNIAVLRTGFPERPSMFTVAGGNAYFVANDGTTGSEVWRSDGTPAGTSLVADLTPGARGSEIFGLTALGQKLLIEDRQHLFSSDGTPTGTTLLSSSHTTWSGCVAGDQYYFLAFRHAGSRDLMKTDGTPEGTTFVAGPSSGFYIQDSPGPTLIPRADGVFIGAKEPATNAGFEPWISNGTASGTQVVKMISPRFTLSSSPNSLANIGGRLFFRARHTDSQGMRTHATWISDGTSAGTSMVPDSSSDWWFDPDAVASGGFYYFRKQAGFGSKLYRTDGTPAGTAALADVSADSTLAPFRNGILWTTEGPRTVELWFSDGTGGGTKMLARIVSKYNGVGVVPQPITVTGDHAFFGLNGYFAGIPEHPLVESQVWRTDGTLAGTQPFNDEDTGRWLAPHGFTRVGPWIYFIALARNYDGELWRVHVTSGESNVVRNLGRTYSNDLARLGDALLFVTEGQLWRSDGTAEGTTLIREGVTSPFRSATVGNGLLFWTGIAGNHRQVWRSDGTAEGTFLLGAFPGQQSAVDAPLYFSDGALFFPGSDPSHGIEPWVSDGTLEGTRILADLNRGTKGSMPSEFLRIGTLLYVSAEERSVGRELWSIEIHCTGKCPPRRQSVRH